MRISARLVSRFFFLSLLAAAGSTLLEREAAAQPPAPGAAPDTAVVIVDVAPGEAELDAVSIRSAIAAELGEPAIEPSDPRAAQATGALKVSIDRAAGALVVSYTGRPSPIERRIKLPADRPATARAAMLLAGNLARNEGEELAASLRPPKTAAPKSDGVDTGAALALDHLGEDLHEAEVGAQKRRAASFLLMGIGAAFGAAALTLNSFGPASSDATTLVPLSTLAYAGFDVLFMSSFLVNARSVDDIATLYATDRGRYPVEQVRQEVEAAWRDRAETEHRQRRMTGWVTTIVGGLGLAATGTGAALMAAQPKTFSNPGWENGATIAAGFGAGSMMLTTGLVMLAVPGYTEAAYRKHAEGESGAKLAETQARAAVSPFLAPTNGGAVFGLGGTF